MAAMEHARVAAAAGVQQVVLATGPQHAAGPVGAGVGVALVGRMHGDSAWQGVEIHDVDASGLKGWGESGGSRLGGIWLDRRDQGGQLLPELDAPVLVTGAG